MLFLTRKYADFFGVDVFLIPQTVAFSKQTGEGGCASLRVTTLFKKIIGLQPRRKHEHENQIESMPEIKE